MGSLDFAAQYQQEPVAEGGNLIKWDWFQFYDKPPGRTPDDRIIVSWDTAMSSKELSSYSACVVLQIRGETVWVLDVVRERLEYPDLRRKVIELHRRWRKACNRYELDEDIEHDVAATGAVPHRIRNQRDRLDGRMNDSR